MTGLSLRIRGSGHCAIAPGCAQGCAWVFWVLLAVFWSPFPAENFPLWGAIMLCREGAIRLAGLRRLGAAAQGRTAKVNWNALRRPDANKTATLQG